jgi:hypothetical protein
MITLDLSILNQKGTPMFNSDLFANRPAAGIVGRIFISTDTNVLYRDNGTTWSLLGGGGGGGTISGSIAAGQVAFGTALNTIGGENNLFWDSTNDRLGIGTNTPNEPLTISTNLNLPNGVRVTNSNIGNSARSQISIINDSGNQGNLSIWGSGTGLANKVLFESSKDFIIGTDSTIPSGGTSKFQIYVNGYNSVLNPQLTLNSTGNLLVGTTTDNGQRLQISGTTLLNGNVTFSSSTGMFWDATNSRLGIGTNTPSDKLEITGSASLAIIGFKIRNTNATGYTEIQCFNNLGTVNDRMYMGVGGTSTGDAFQNRGYFVASGNIDGINFTALKTTGDIRFLTGGVNERVRIFANGNFGINTGASDNGYTLQVTGNQSTTQTTTYTSGVVHSNVVVRNTTFNAGAISGSTGVCNFVGTGDNIINGNLSVPNTTSFAGIYQYNKYQFGAAGLTFTVTQASPGGLRAVTQLFTQNVFKGSNSGTITHMAGLQIGGFYSENSGTITPIIPNVYQLLINDTGAYLHTFTFTNRWGIYQEGINDRNYLAGNLLLNSTVDTGQILQVTGAIRINGQASGTAGGASGNHLIVNVDGTQYKIALLNP